MPNRILRVCINAKLSYIAASLRYRHEISTILPTQVEEFYKPRPALITKRAGIEVGHVDVACAYVRLNHFTLSAYTESPKRNFAGPKCQEML